MKTIGMRVLFLVSVLLASAGLARAADQYWSGAGASSDNIDQDDNWFTVHPQPGDNLYFNNTSGFRHFPFSNYGTNSYFGFFISYSGANGIRLRGDKTYLWKFENNSDPSLLEAEADLSNRSLPDSDIEINPVGGGVTISNLDLQNGMQLKVYGANTLTVNGNITQSGTGNATMAILGGGTVILNGSNTYGGVTTISNGTLQVGTGGTSGTLGSGNVTDNGTLVFNRSDAVTWSNVISGTGTLTKQGGGTLTLPVANSYTGVTVISGGTLKVGNGGALGTSAGGTIVTNGGTLDENGMNLGAEVITISGAGVGGNGAIVSSAGAPQTQAFQYINLAGDATIGGSTRWDVRTAGAYVNLNGNTLTKTGVNYIAFVNTSVTNTGNIVVNQGTLAFSVTMAVSGAGTITINSGGTLAPGNWGGAMLLTKPVTINGGTLAEDTGSAGVTVGAPITLNAGAFTNFISAPDAFLALTNVISGAAGFTKTGGNVLILKGSSNTYAGATTINAGTIYISGDENLGTANTNLIFGGGALQVTNSVALNNRPVTLNAGGGTFIVDAASVLTVSNSITGAGALSKSGVGTLALTGTNTYAGVTTVSGGTLLLPSGGVITNNSQLIIAALGGAQVVINGGSDTENSAGSNATSPLYLGGPGGQAGMLIVSNGSFSASNAGGQPIIGDSGTGIVIQAGGSIYLAGPTYVANNGASSWLHLSNGTFVAASGINLGVRGVGTLNLGGSETATVASLTFAHPSTTGSGIVNLGGNALLRAGSITKPNAGATGIFNFNGGTLRALTNSTGFLTGITAANVLDGGAILDDGGFAITIGQSLLSGGGGIGGLTKLGSGTQTVSGASTYGGATAINAGRLQLSSGPNRLPVTTSVAMTNAATAVFDLNSQTQTVMQLIGGGSVALGAGALTVGDATSNNFSGTISGAGTLTKKGTGVLILYGTNTYSGVTTINNGLLAVEANTAIRGPTMINSGATFRIDAAGAFNGLNPAHTIGISNATLHVVGTDLNPGKITFYDGGQSIGPGNTYIRYGFESLASVNTALLGHVSIALVSDQMGGVPMTFTAADGAADIDLLVTSRVTRIGGLTKLGAGKMAMAAGNNDYSGTTTISNGTLALLPGATITGSSKFSLGATSAVFDVSSIGTFALGGFQTLEGNGSVTGNVTTVAGSRIYPGAPVVAGTLTFNGNLGLNAGTTNFFDLTTSTVVGSGTNDLVVVNGNLSPSNSVVAINALTPLSSGTYTLFTFSGTNDTFFSPSLVGNAGQSRQTIALDQTNTPGQINLIVAGNPGALVWNSTAGTNWDIQTSTNWFNAGTASNDVFFNFDHVVFDDTPGVATAVVIASNVQPGSVTFSNSANLFTISGPAKITGATGLTKLGTNSVVIATTNDFSGVVRIAEGTLVAGNGSAFGSTAGGTVITNSGTLEINGINLGGEVVTISGAGTGGNGAVVNNGADQANALQQLVLAGDATVGGTRRWDVRNAGTAVNLNGNTLTKTGTNIVAFIQSSVTNAGSITVNQGEVSIQQGAVVSGPGTITVNDGGIFGVGNYGTAISVTKPIVLNGGTLREDGLSGGATVAAPITVNAATTNTINVLDAALTLSGMLSGSGTINLTGPGGGNAELRPMSAANTNFTGVINNFGVRLNDNLTSPAAIGNPSIINIATGGQMYATTAGIYSQALALAGTGWNEAAGILGALRMQSGTWAGPITLTTNASVGSYGNSSRINGTISGPFELEFRSGISPNNDTLTFTPPSPNVYGSFKLNTGCTAVAGNTNAFCSGGLTMNGGVLKLNGNDASFANLSGNGLIQNGSTTNAMLTVGSDGTSTAYNSAITNGGAGSISVTKLGAGTLTLNGASAWSGSTTVSNGTLVVASSLAGTDTVYVATNAALVYAGTVKGALFSDGSVSLGSAMGTLNASNGFTQGASGSLTLKIGGAATAGVDYDEITGGNIALAGSLNLTLPNTNYVPALGDTFFIVNAASGSGFFSATNAPSPGSNLVWDVQYFGNLVVLSITNGTTPPPNGYALYVQQITNALTGYQDDADADGYANLLEYVTGGNPTNLDAAANMDGLRIGGLLALKFNRDTNATDATLIVEGGYSSTNDTTWTGIATNLGGSWGGAPNVSESGTNNPVSVTVQDTDPLATNRFLRLRITRP